MPCAGPQSLPADREPSTSLNILARRSFCFTPDCLVSLAIVGRNGHAYFRVRPQYTWPAWRAMLTTPNTMVTSVFRSRLQGLSSPWTRINVPLEVARGRVLLCGITIGAMSHWPLGCHTLWNLDTRLKVPPSDAAALEPNERREGGGGSFSDL